MKVWRIVKPIFVWLYIVGKAMFLAITGLGFVIGGILVLPRVYDFMEGAQASWQPATSFPENCFNWLVLIIYQWTPFMFFLFCLVWCIVFFVKAIKGGEVKG